MGGIGLCAGEGEVPRPSAGQAGTNKWGDLLPGLLNLNGATDPWAKYFDPDVWMRSMDRADHERHL